MVRESVSERGTEVPNIQHILRGVDTSNLHIVKTEKEYEVVVTKGLIDKIKFFFKYFNKPTLSGENAKAFIANELREIPNRIKFRKFESTILGKLSKGFEEMTEEVQLTEQRLAGGATITKALKMKDQGEVVLGQLKQCNCGKPHINRKEIETNIVKHTQGEISPKNNNGKLTYVGLGSGHLLDTAHTLGQIIREGLAKGETYTTIDIDLVDTIYAEKPELAKLSGELEGLKNRQNELLAQFQKLVDDRGEKFARSLFDFKELNELSRKIPAKEREIEAASARPLTQKERDVSQLKAQFEHICKEVAGACGIKINVQFHSSIDNLQTEFTKGGKKADIITAVDIELSGDKPDFVQGFESLHPSDETRALAEKHGFHQAPAHPKESILKGNGLIAYSMADISHVNPKQPDVGFIKPKKEI